MMSKNCRAVFFAAGFLCILIPPLSSQTDSAAQPQAPAPADQHAKELEASDELLKLGESFVTQGQLTRAIPILEKAVQLNSGNERAKEALIQAYQQQANAYSKQGHMDQALSILARVKALSQVTQPTSESSSASPSNSVLQREIVNVKKFIADTSEQVDASALADDRARSLFKEAKANYEKKQYALAKSAVTEGLKYHPKEAPAYELLGDIEYFGQNNLSAAIEAYEQAYLLGRNSRVQQKLEKLGKEQKIKSRFAEYMDEHFVIHYKRSEKFEGSQIRDFLRDSYRSVSHDFGYYLNYKTTVILYDKDEYEAIEKMPHWSGALYDGKIRIPIYGVKAKAENLHKFIQHELTHVFIIDMSANHCPVWLHEGLAQYEENKIIPIDLVLFKTAARRNELFSWNDLQKGVAGIADQSKAVLFYHQSYMMATYLIDKYRFVKIKQLLLAMAKGQSLEDAFQATYGMSSADFMAKWNKEVQAQFGA